MEKTYIVGLVKEESKSDLWHKILGHMTKWGLKILAEQNILPRIKGT